MAIKLSIGKLTLAQPLDDTYQEFRVAERGESLAAKSIPNLTIDADVVLG